MIARTDTLLVPRSGDPVISFTRSPEVAIDFATLPKDFDDGFPTVFVFDRQSLQSRYRLEAFQQIPREGPTIGKFDMEERVWYRDIRPMSRHLGSIFYCVGNRVRRTTYLPRYSIIADVLARAKIGSRSKTSAVDMPPCPRMEASKKKSLPHTHLWSSDAEHVGPAIEYMISVSRVAARRIDQRMQ